MQFSFLDMPPAANDEELPEFDHSLGQFMTPAWVASAIVERELPDLPAGALVLEPTAGTGRFLDALPPHVRAVGVEIDPRLAAIARAKGHEIIQGDFRTCELPFDRVDYGIGNPPFSAGIIDQILARAKHLFRKGGKLSFILPSYALQNPARILAWHQDWGLEQIAIPRTIWPRLHCPLVLATFTRDSRVLKGFFLYHETVEVQSMPAVYRKAAAEGRSGWRAVVTEALRRLGGKGTLRQVYAEVAPARPTENKHWQARIRATLRENAFKRIGNGEYALA